MSIVDHGLTDGKGPLLYGRIVRRTLPLADFTESSAAIDVATASGTLFDGRLIRFGAAATTTDVITVSGVLPANFVGINTQNKLTQLFVDVAAYKEGSGTDNTDLALRCVFTAAGATGLTISQTLPAKATAFGGVVRLRFDIAAAARAAGLELAANRLYTIAFSPNEVVGTNLALNVLPQCIGASCHSSTSAPLGAAV